MWNRRLSTLRVFTGLISISALLVLILLGLGVVGLGSALLIVGVPAFIIFFISYVVLSAQTASMEDLRQQALSSEERDIVNDALARSGRFHGGSMGGD